jgi:hypothetical protein
MQARLDARLRAPCGSCQGWDVSGAASLPPPPQPQPAAGPPHPWGSLPPPPLPDSLVVVPQRRAPTEAAAAAAAEAHGLAPADAADDDDDGPLTFRLPPDAPAWHRALASFLRRRLGTPDLALAWLFALGPGRLAVFAAVLAGARVASGYGLGPLYLMVAIVVAIWTNLGDRKEGEASAYRWAAQGAFGKADCAALVTGCSQSALQCSLSGSRGHRCLQLLEERHVAALPPCCCWLRALVLPPTTPLMAPPLTSRSVFNPGVRRLPGELDAAAFDGEIRRGAGVG